ncbi:MAG: adenylate/guanylate cyclase domain-containing protein [Pseudomonadota bacterium]
MINIAATTRRPMAQGIGIALIAGLLSTALWGLGWLDSWEARSFDWRARAMARPGPATDQIRLILVDQNSLDWAQRENGLGWPWPREMYAAVVDFCRRHGVRAIAIDVLFTEPSTYGVPDDQVFAESVGAAPDVALAAFIGQETGARRQWPQGPAPVLPVPAPVDGWIGRHPNGGFVFPRASLPIDALRQAAAALGNVQIPPDPDGIYRRAPLFAVFDGRMVPTLAVAPWVIQHPGVAVFGTDMGGLTLAGKRVPTDANGRVILRFRGSAGTYRSYSAAAVLQSEIRLRDGQAPTITDPDAFRGKIVFLGFSAPGLFEARATPMGGVFSGVEIQATLLDNVISNDFIRPLSTGASVALILSIAALLGVTGAMLASTTAIMIVAAFGLSVPVAVAAGGYHLGVWVPLVAVELAAILTVALTLVMKIIIEGRQKRFIKNAFSQYLSPVVIEQLIANPERLKLGGERKMLSIFFSDLQGFTTISEGLDPEALTALLNDYLSAMTDIIWEEGGTVDKYEGDAIIAFWNAPLEVADHAACAVRAALRCQQTLGALRPKFRERTGKDLYMRIGINTGEAVVGNLGSSSRFDYTMLGDAVNLAARLEGANKQFGTYTMISQNTRILLDERFVVRELARLAVVGRKAPVGVFEPMFPADAARCADLVRTFQKGLGAFYEGRFQDAQALFEDIAGTDPAAAVYAGKCAQLRDHPPADWQGVWVATSK